MRYVKLFSLVLLLGCIGKEDSDTYTFHLDEPVTIDYFSTRQDCRKWSAYRDTDGKLHVWCAYDANVLPDAGKDGG